MGILADIGRSNLGQASQSLLDDVHQYARQQRLSQTQDIEDRMNILKTQKMQQDLEDYNRDVDIDQIPIKYANSGMASLGKAIHGYVTALGLYEEVDTPDGQKKKIGKKGEILKAIDDYPKMMDKMPDFQKSVLWAKVEDSDNSIVELEKQLGKAKDPNEMKGITDQIESAKRERDMYSKSYRELAAPAALERAASVRDVAQIRADVTESLGNRRLDIAEDKQKETKRHNIASEKIARLRAERVSAGGGTKGGKPTALIQNVAFLAELGWDKEEAIKLLTSSKPMSRDTFIGQATLRVFNNPYILQEDREAAVQSAVDYYDKVLAQSPNKPTPGGAKAGAAGGPPTGFVDSGKTSGGKKVYVSPDGKSAWVAP